MRTLLCSLASAGVAAAATLSMSDAAAPAARSPQAILESYVADFRSDGAASTPRIFGVRVDGGGDAGDADAGAWTVVVGGTRDESGAWSVELRPDASDEAAFDYVLDAATLAAIDAGRLNALTAQGKAFPGDASPMNVAWRAGVEPHDVNAFSFHFWTRGFPEKVPFASDLTRVVHGVDNVALYYQPGLRCIWSSIAKGQRASNGPGQPIVVPFPAIVLGLSGLAQGVVAGERVSAGAGEMVFIPPMTPYEWWNDDDEPAEALLLFFGDGA